MASEIERAIYRLESTSEDHGLIRSGENQSARDDARAVLLALIDPERRAREQAVILQAQKLLDGDSRDLIDLRRAVYALDATEPDKENAK